MGFPLQSLWFDDVSTAIIIYRRSTYTIKHNNGDSKEEKKPLKRKVSNKMLL